MSNFNQETHAHFGDHIANYCDAIEGMILSVESDPAAIRGAQIALDAMRRIVGVSIPHRDTIESDSINSSLPVGLHYRIR